jgi:hypothetical protein
MIARNNADKIMQERSLERTMLKMNLTRPTDLTDALVKVGINIIIMQSGDILGWLYNNTIKSSVDAYFQSCEDAKADILIAEYIRLKKERLEMNDESGLFGFTLLGNVNTLSAEKNFAIDMMRTNAFVSSAAGPV